MGIPLPADATVILSLHRLPHHATPLLRRPSGCSSFVAVPVNSFADPPPRPSGHERRRSLAPGSVSYRRPPTTRLAPPLDGNATLLPHSRNLDGSLRRSHRRRTVVHRDTHRPPRRRLAPVSEPHVVGTRQAVHVPKPIWRRFVREPRGRWAARTGIMGWRAGRRFPEPAAWRHFFRADGLRSTRGRLWSHAGRHTRRHPSTLSSSPGPLVLLRAGPHPGGAWWGPPGTRGSPRWVSRAFPSRWNSLSERSSRSCRWWGRSAAEVHSRRSLRSLVSSSLPSAATAS